MATSNVAVPADDLNSKAVALIVNKDSFSNYADIASRQFNENSLGVLVSSKTYPILLSIENNSSSVSTVTDVSDFSRKRKYNDSDNDFALSLYVKSLEKNDLTLESWLLLRALRRGKRALSYCKIMSYSSLTIKHRLTGADRVEKWINLLTTEGSDLELKNIPKFVKYEPIMDLSDLDEIYKARNVNYLHGASLCFDTLGITLPAHGYPEWKNLWVYHRTGYMKGCFPSNLIMLGLSNFGSAFNISWSELVGRLTKLAILVTDNCSITSTVYNTLPSKHKLKVLICLDKKCRCYNALYKKSFRGELTIVPASQNSNSFYYDVSQARKANKRNNMRRDMKGERFNFRFTIRGKIFYRDDGYLSKICKLELPEVFRSTDAKTIGVQKRSKRFAAGF
uniref:DDE_Tnp_1_7 domain-containing protein n=1 Tax=Strongyloides venezuelensis TaxID=75913 RepID=A0A0K0FNY8_STRVS